MKFAECFHPGVLDGERQIIFLHSCIDVGMESLICKTVYI